MGEATTKSYFRAISPHLVLLHAPCLSSANAVEFDRYLLLLRYRVKTLPAVSASSEGRADGAGFNFRRKTYSRLRYNKDFPVMMEVYCMGSWYAAERCFGECYSELIDLTADACIARLTWTMEEWTSAVRLLQRLYRQETLIRRCIFFNLIVNYL